MLDPGKVNANVLPVSDGHQWMTSAPNTNGKAVNIKSPLPQPKLHFQLSDELQPPDDQEVPCESHLPVTPTSGTAVTAVEERENAPIARGRRLGSRCELPAKRHRSPSAYSFSSVTSSSSSPIEVKSLRLGPGNLNFTIKDKSVWKASEAKSNAVRLSWHLTPEELKQDSRLRLELSLYYVEYNEDRTMRLHPCPKEKSVVLPIDEVGQHTFELDYPGEYSVQLLVVDHGAGEDVIIGDSGHIRFRAIFSRRQLQYLLKLFLSHAGTRMHHFAELHRCKDSSHFDELIAQHGSLMEKYPKGDTGHPASGLKRALYGLFFSPKVDDHCRMPSRSPFGNERFRLFARRLLDIREQKLNFYFADFYCLRYEDPCHYATVVVAENGSDADAYCRENLLPLNDMESNHLLHIREVHMEDVTFEENAHPKVYVELFWTGNDVPLAWGRREPVEPYGAGQSNPNGIPSIISCAICNPAELEEAGILDDNSDDE